MAIRVFKDAAEKPHVQVKIGMFGNYQKFEFFGQLIYGQTEEAKKIILDHSREAKGYFFDMRNLASIDSTGLGMLVTIAKRLKNTADSRMAVIVEEGMMKEIFTMARFHLIFPMVGSEAEGIRLFEEDSCSDLMLNEY